ncbi:hypothetical protein [Pseudomonas syringae]|uniref:hypothetical protein n=1 Tax=Pseudomonas syringae TaxID=317 RepID=UPI00165DF822|nr:hypothetical protein [Pseudomonas syringae]QNR42580.1 hypothetical protein D5S12_15025 [Pseudomonas syringae]
MDKQDFSSSDSDFKLLIGTRRFDVESATSILLDMAGTWNQYGQELLGGIISICNVPEESRIDGEVLGKKFCLRYAGYGVEGRSALEVALTIRNLVTGENIELSTFFVSAEGLILSSDGEELLNLTYRDSGYKVLVAVVRRVMNASSTG